MQELARTASDNEVEILFSKTGRLVSGPEACSFETGAFTDEVPFGPFVLVSFSPFPFRLLVVLCDIFEESIGWMDVKGIGHAQGLFYLSSIVTYI